MRREFLLFLLFSSATCQPCGDNVSVDLSDMDTFRDGSIMKNGVHYPPKFIYSKNVTGVIKTFGCICELKPCFRKCCPMGSVMLGRECAAMPEHDNITNHGLAVHYINNLIETVDIRSKSNPFAMFYGRPCPKVYLSDDGREFVQKDGKLHIESPEDVPPWILRTPDKYCVDTFVLEEEDGVISSRLDALVCFSTDAEDPHNYLLSAACMLISCVFILATLAVYAWLPELRNLYGKVLMAYLSCLLLAFLLLGSMQVLVYVDNINTNMCLVLTFFIYFSMLSAFFWLNVMCFDIYWTFSGKRGLSLEKLSNRGRFLAYSTYAFGVPSVLTALLIGLEFSGMPVHPLMPALRHHGCFIHGNRKLLYLYGPILLLSLANIAFFTLTTIRIAGINRQTSVLQNKESATHDHQRKDKQRLLLYVKLFSVMGVSWILEVFSALYPEAQLFWQFTDSYNALIGVSIFVVFVCKRKIFRLIKKRYNHLRGVPMARNQSSMGTCSSRDDVRMTVSLNHAT
ncbi:hypothetical protein JYU34_005657 [Plutella xylostella]|uniref:G-protein coupled receptors family 2 profile 2 domain-containing protein n=1 Tax=Plutella xylostella TaxID=51655 RepID=A0ABQ7QTS5_PLUXY|nr:hypothetical protein JYU34_005657 [Plutella xylostella]